MRSTNLSKLLNAEVNMGTKPKTKETLAADLINCVPTNWLDPLLTGDAKVLPDGYEYTPKDIEKLLLAIRKRMETTAGI